MATNRMASPTIALVRAEYVFPFIDLFRYMGMPVDRALTRARLPALIEESPRTYLSTDLVYRFLAYCSKSQGIDDLGFEAGWGLTFEQFGSDLKNALLSAPTLKAGIESFARLVALEDSEFRCELLSGDRISRVHVRQYVPPGQDSRIAEWQNLKAIIEVIRSYAGPDWLPPAIGFTSATALSKRARHRLDQIRIITGQQTAFVQFPSRLLAQRKKREHGLCSCPLEDRFSAEQLHRSFPDYDDLATRLRAVLAPYLSAGYPNIGLAAEIAGTSVRDLQRRLDRMQTTYSRMIDTLRIERALYLLQETDLKILDIALMLGYQDASNFARAIRRMTGASPRDLRRFVTIGDPSRTGTK